jgi:hypothetical protein
VNGLGDFHVIILPDILARTFDIKKAVLKIADFYALWCQADMMSLWEFP